MKALLVDDEELQLLRLKGAAEKALPGCELLCYTNPVKALKETESEKIDVAFLDIEMPVINGLRLARKLKMRDPDIRVVFVTAYDQYALEAFKVHASGYLSKPVNEAKIREEMEQINLPPLSLKPQKKIQAKCFGNFELFHNGEPIKFARSKSKELLAYLIDREGSAISVAELNAILWEEDRPSYLRNLISDIQRTLKEIDCDDVFIKRHNECYVDVSKIDCDAYEFKNNNPEAIRMFRGQYMYQYSWAMFVDD